MRLIQALTLSLLIVTYGMPLTARAQEGQQTFSLPECRAGEVCRINIESALREKYHLRLEADAGAQVFRWALAGGDLPAGLVLRPSGTIVGTPRAASAQPYYFEVRVAQARVRGAEPLKLGLSLQVAAPRIRLARINSPRLVPATASEAAAGAASNGDPEGGSSSAPTASARAVSFFNGSNATFGDSVTAAATDASNGREDARDAPARSAFVHLLADSSPRGALSASPAGPLPQVLPTPPCEISTPPTPSPAPGAGVFYLDARNGNLTEGGQLVTPRRRFKKGQRVVVVVDNKNPYLYTYNYVPTATPVGDPALGKFVPFLVGDLGDLNAAPAAPAPPQDAAPPITPTATGAPPPTPDPCRDAIAKTNTLTRDVRSAVSDNESLRRGLDDQKRHSRRLTDAYNAARLPLFAQNQTRQNLYQASVALVRAVDTNMGTVGVNPESLDDLERRIGELTRKANRFKSRVEAIRDAHADCLSRIGEQLRVAQETADDLLSNAQNYQQVLDQIRESLQTAVEGRTLVLTVLCNPNSFFEVHVEGGFEETNEVAIQLTVTPRQGVAEAQAVPGSPFSTTFTFGGAPFFSISGGPIFSPLRKREYVRVQGFERDREGNLVLDNGNPKLATVVGLKESSPTRITPAIFLNGRLKSWDNGYVDGLHMTLGITAKNDNEGTDVEFLVGPSFSLLDRRLFFTVGGYAGKQQKLAGDLFEGFALPESVDEIPIEKNYRWNVGFSLSYRIPVTQ